MDSDSEDSGSCVSSDSGFLDGALEIDEALWEHDVCIKPRGFATEPPLNAPASASAPPDADLGEERNNVLRELLEQVPEVELPWFLDHALPKLDPEVNIASLVEQMKQNGLINDEGHWALWDGHPISKHNAKENIAYNPFQTLAEKICAQSGLGRTRKQTVAFVCIPDQPPMQETRSNTSKPDCAAILLKDDGTPVWKPRPKPPPKDKDGSGKAKKSKGNPPTSQTPDASAPQSKPPKEKRVKTEEEKQIDRDRRKEKQEREKEHTLRWLDMAAPGEFKLDGNNAKYAHDNQKKILWSLAYVLREDPRRRFVHGFTIEDTTMRLWFCSRSDVLVSKPFDFMKDHETTVRFILSISFATRIQLGWDPTMKVVQGTEGADIKFDIEVRDHVTGNIRTFRTIRILSNIGADAVRGRGTRVWEVCELKDGKPIMRPALDVNGKPILDANGQPTEEPVTFALKDCWSDDDRTLEGIIMDEVYPKNDEEDKLVSSIRKAFMPFDMHGEVFVEGQPDHTRKVILQSEKLPPPSGVLHVPIEYTARAKVASKLPSVGSVALERRSLEVAHLYSGKIHYRIVYAKVGKTLFSVDRMSTMFRHLANVARGIRLLYERQWIHRDISVGNILIVENDERRPDGKKSESPRISDMEYAKRVLHNQQPHGIRTGTLFFMSTEVYVHSYLHWHLQGQQIANAPVDLDFALEVFPDLEDVPEPSTPPPRPVVAVDIEDVPFRHHILHDAESLFWLGLYMLLVSLIKFPQGVSQEEMKKYTGYQKAHHVLATKLFCNPLLRTLALSSDNFLLHEANTLGLHPQVREAILFLDPIRFQIVQAFVHAERNLHKEPHLPDLEGANQLLINIAVAFYELFKRFKINDVLLTPRRKAPTRLEKVVKADMTKRKPDGQPNQDESSLAKKVKTEDGPVASGSNAGRPGDGVSGNATTVVHDVFGPTASSPEAPMSFASGSHASGPSPLGSSSSKAPGADVEQTPRKPKRTDKGKGKEVSRDQ